jgi:hypothetical protein
MNLTLRYKKNVVEHLSAEESTIKYQGVNCAERFYNSHIPLDTRASTHYTPPEKSDSIRYYQLYSTILMSIFMICFNYENKIGSHKEGFGMTIYNSSMHDGF